MKDPSVDIGREDGWGGSTSSSLLVRVRKKVPGAWERLSALYCPVVYGWARRAGLSPEDAADVVQEVFLALVTHLSSFEHQRSDATFRGWLWTITQNKIRDLHRRGAGRAVAAGGTDAQQRLLEVPEPQTSGSLDSGSRHPSTLLARALECIRSEFEACSWQAFWGVVVEGKAPVELAATLGISVNAVYIARSRILRRLREELRDPPS